MGEKDREGPAEDPGWNLTWVGCVAYECTVDPCHTRDLRKSDRHFGHDKDSDLNASNETRQTENGIKDNKMQKNLPNLPPFRSDIHWASRGRGIWRSSRLQV